ncbi:hypothetical protein L6164_037638 [Bauhinia variegata]|uniref:Uncharacterized protein n=1 Tax=Bauhinia variegata TaxID=167791 RepID=A0ACB9KKV6_BAUVA|nr:hypothetical protein L6164_037638 [Bauhinia variegata]
MAIQAQLCSNNLGFPLYSSSDLLIDNGCSGTGGCFISRPKIQQQPQQIEQHLRQEYDQRFWNQNMFDSNYLSSMLNSQSLAAQFENQRQEIDQYIRLQDEKLRIFLLEQRKQQLTTVFQKVESQALYLLRQKDEELTQAAKRKVELEDFLRRLEAENQAWRRVAEENEAMVFSLHNNLEEMKEKAFYCPNNGFMAEDVESCCDQSSNGDRENGEAAGTEENRVGDAEEQSTRKTMMMVCKGCNSRSSCFLFLPCRHLSSCKACEPYLEACPVCREPKKACIETSIF